MRPASFPILILKPSLLDAKQVAQEQPQILGPRPEIAFRLSVVGPGLGQIFAGAPLRGALFFVLASLGLSGILESIFDPRRYLLHGVLGALLSSETSGEASPFD